MAKIKTYPYYGSKENPAKWTNEYFPKDARLFADVFFGSGRVFFNTPKHRHEIINDAWDEVTNFFEQCRSNTQLLSYMVNMTAVSPRELELAFEPSINPLERARRFYVRAYMGRKFPDVSISFRNRWNGIRASSLGKDFHRHSFYDVADRIREATIYNMDAIELIKKLDAVLNLIYCDPPYPMGTRAAKVNGRYFGDDKFNQDKFLAACVAVSDAYIVVASYRNDLYDKVLGGAGWSVTEKSARTDGRDRIEALYLNPNVMEALARDNDKRREDQERQPLLNYHPPDSKTKVEG